MKICDKFQQVKLQTILELFVPMFVLEHNWNAEDQYEDLWQSKRQYLVRLLVDEVRQGRLSGMIAGGYIDKDGNETEKRERTDFILDEKETWFDMKDALRFLTGILHQYEPAFSHGGVAAPEVEASEEHHLDEGETGYPAYRGLKLEDLTKEKLDKVKTHYGLMRAEVAKLEKTIKISTNIGLLFYQKGLAKPATPTAFMEAYKESVAGIPARLTKLIYDALPQEYKSFEGESAKQQRGIDAETLEVIMEASVAAGLIGNRDQIGTEKDLEKGLARYDVDLPPATYLKPIFGAYRRMYKNYKEQSVDE